MSIRTWQDSLQILKHGNQQFLNQKRCQTEHQVDDLQKLEDGQNPYAIILCCSDSRVSPDIIFNQPLGNLFVIQNAGNVCDTSVLGSIQYSLKHLGTPLVVILGHSLCGAVSAAHKHQEVHGPLKCIIDLIDEHVLTNSIEDSIQNHAKKTAEQVRDVLAPYESQLSQAVRVISAYYDIGSGEISWLDE